MYYIMAWLKIELKTRNKSIATLSPVYILFTFLTSEQHFLELEQYYWWFKQYIRLQYYITTVLSRSQPFLHNLCDLSASSDVGDRYHSKGECELSSWSVQRRGENLVRERRGGKNLVREGRGVNILVGGRGVKIHVEEKEMEVDEH